MTAEKYYNKIVEICLDVGEKRTSKLQTHPRVQDLYGMCGLRTRHFLNALLSSGKMTYLELGVYRGASLTCALYENPEVKAYGVDNWQYSAIDHPSIKYEKDANGNDTKKTIPWENCRYTAFDNLKKYTSGNYTILEKDFKDLKKSDIPDPVDIVHVQPNPGVTKSELMAYLNTVYPLLEVTSVLIMEYHISGEIQEAIQEWCKAKNIKIEFSFTKDSDSMVNNLNWLGGLGVYIITKQVITK